MKIEARAEWRASQNATSKRWIGTCEILNLAVEAHSLRELLDVIQEATQLLLLDLLRDGEPEAFLAQRGWRLRQNAPQTGDPRFELPWEITTPLGRITGPARRPGRGGNPS